MSFKFHIVATMAIAGLAGPAAAQTSGQTSAPTSSQAAVPATPPAAARPEAEARSPLQAAVLRAAAGEADVRAWYEARDGRPAWNVSGGAMDAQALLARLDEAESHALPAARYSPAALRERARGAIDSEGRPEDMAQLELDLTRALVRYAGDMSAGALVPNRVVSEIHLKPVRPQTPTLLTAAAASPDLGAWLDALAPRDPGYDQLRALYASLQQEAAAGGWRATLSEGGTLREGDEGPRVTQLRARLDELGEAAPDTARPALYDDGLVEAVKRFQRRHGLNDDGIAGARTFGALGADVGHRIRQVAVNLERMRWAPQDLGRKYIVVNQADYRMRLIEDGRQIHEARVVIGQRRHRTPEFIDMMDHMVINPSWNVPRSITMNEILPALREDPTYLARKNMQVIATDGGPVPVDTTLHDWGQYGSGYFPYRVKQAPGEGNALGKVKFMFPNQFSIYLHDTPSKNLFRRDERAFSHGCVRVENPFELAYLLLAPQYEDPQAAFHSILDSGRERWVHLDEPVRVNLTYRTAWVDETGREQFRADVYGRDEAVWAALEEAGLAPVY